MFFGRDDVEEYVVLWERPLLWTLLSQSKARALFLRKAMGTGAKPIAPMVIEVDKDNPNKDIDKLDIEIPVMSPRIQRGVQKSCRIKCV